MRLPLLAAIPVLAFASILAASGCATTAEIPDDDAGGGTDAAADRGKPNYDSGTPRRDAEITPPPPDDGGTSFDGGTSLDGGSAPDAAKDGGIDAGPPVDGGGATCQNATALVNGVLVNGTTTGAGDDYDYGPTASVACDPEFGFFTYDGPDVAFSYTIPAGKTLKVDVSSLNQWDIAVGIVTNCAQAGPSCLIGSDAAGDVAETVSYKNNGNQPLPVYIIVDSFLPSENGPFTILATEM